MAVSFFVAGEPKTAGSKKAFIYRDKITGQMKPSITDDTGEIGKAWRTDIRAAAQEAMGERPPFAGALAVRLVFWMPRPKAHYRTGANEGILKENAPIWHIARPDTDKLIRAVLDALTNLVYADDGQVCQLPTPAKLYTNDRRPGVRVTITRPALEEVLHGSLTAGGFAPSLFERTNGDLEPAGIRQSSSSAVQSG